MFREIVIIPYDSDLKRLRCLTLHRRNVLIKHTFTLGLLFCIVDVESLIRVVFLMGRLVVLLVICDDDEGLLSNLEQL
jgi:hypothetical protein